MSRAVIAAVVLVAGCSGPTVALDPAGPQSGHIAGLWWVFFAVCVAVLVLVTLAVVVAIVRGRVHARGAEGSAIIIDAGHERGAAALVGTLTLVTAGVLVVLLVASILTGRALSSPTAPSPLAIQLVGHQWWWEVIYPDVEPSKQVTTANEIHVPTGRPVTISLASRDVIHSFWVPQLHGKRDLIPGHGIQISFQADRAGIYEGQCAEYCGMQHALMRLKVFAQPPADFAAWLEGQRASAPEPTTDATRRGRDVVVTWCAYCHTVQGTDARGTNGPDLTHLASRTTLAAGTMPNTPGHLAGWIVDPQGVKPGTQMPAVSLDPESLQSLLAYLETLR